MIEQCEKILKQHRSGNLILLLQEIQDVFGYIPEDVVYWFSKKLMIPASKFYGIITFYPKFRLKPVGKNSITVCCGAACHIKGGEDIYENIKALLKLSKEEDTTKDLSFTVHKATCIGACSIAPIVVLNSDVYGNMNVEKVKDILSVYIKDDGS